jgi:hypothetical protein
VSSHAGAGAEYSGSHRPLRARHAIVARLDPCWFGSSTTVRATSEGECPAAKAHALRDRSVGGVLSTAVTNGMDRESRRCTEAA